MMTVAKLLDKPEKWCGHDSCYAKTSAGKSCFGDDKEAAQFSLVGAIDACYPKQVTRKRAYDKAFAAAKKIIQTPASAGCNLSYLTTMRHVTFEMIRRVIEQANI